MNWLLTLGSLGGVLALAGIARLLGLGRSGALSADEVTGLVEAEYAPFRVDRILLDSDGQAALVRGTDGRLVAVKVHGAHLASRLLTLPVAASEQGDQAVIATGDRWFGPLRLRLDAGGRDSLRTML